MGKKKAPQNGFYYFMVERKRDVEKRVGRDVTMAELPALLYTEWKEMSEEEKMIYKKMKTSASGHGEKLDCRGVPLREIQAENENKKKKIEEMKNYIMNTVEMLKSGNALHRATFYVVSATYYVLTEEGDYVPAELAILEFGFQKGITRDYHAIFKPEIPLSYGFLAKLYSQNNHKLLEQEEENVGQPVVPDGLDKYVVCQDFKKFIRKEGNKLPPLYTLEELIPQTEAILDQMCDVDANDSVFRVYSLDQLFQAMYSVNHQIPQSIATDMLTHCSLDYHPTLPCEWHQTNQKDAGLHCPLGCIRRWVFHICDNIKLEENFGIVPVEGKHKPEALPEFGVVVNVDGPTFNERIGLKSATSRSWGSISFEDKGFSFSHKDQTSGFKKTESQSSIRTTTSQDTSQSRAQPRMELRRPKGVGRAATSWSNVAAPQSFRTSSSRSFVDSSIDTSIEEDFPALGHSYSRGAAK